MLLKGSESNKINIVSKEASHRQKLNGSIFPPSLDINTCTDFRKTCRRARSDQARRQFFSKIVK